MSRLHTVQATITDIARHFGVDPVPALAVPEETTEGVPELAIIEKGGHFQFGQTIASERFDIERTEDRWRSAGKPRAADKQFAFL